MSSFAVGGTTVPMFCLEDGFSEKVLSALVRDLTFDVLLDSAADWEALAGITTDLDRERLPSGEYHFDEQGGAGQGALLFDNRGAWVAYLTDASLRYFNVDTAQYRVSCAFTTISGAPEP